MKPKILLRVPPKPQNPLILASKFIIIIKNPRMEEACSNFIDLQTVDMFASHSEITEQIMQQMQNLGFLALSNIPDYNEQELFAHQKWFFSLSDQVK